MVYGFSRSVLVFQSIDTYVGNGTTVSAIMLARARQGSRNASDSVTDVARHFERHRALLLPTRDPQNNVPTAPRTWSLQQYRGILGSMRSSSCQNFYYRGGATFVSHNDRLWLQGQCLATTPRETARLQWWLDHLAKVSHLRVLSGISDG